MADNKNKFLGTLLNSIPYANSIYNSLNPSNPKYDAFDELPDNINSVITKHSVFSDNLNNPSSFLSHQDYTNFMYARLDPNKVKRIQDYRSMASFAELSDAIDEICDEAISEDRKGNIIKFEFKKNFTDNARKEIRNAWQNYINMFDLENKGFDYFRQFLIDGELYFENIISEKKDMGILGVALLPCELINPIYKNRQNDYIENYILRKPILDEKLRAQSEEVITMDENQVVYINSGIWNEDKTIRLPYIENSRRAYKQLSLIEDSIVIYRLVRAPERLVFKVDVGNMSAPQAESHLKRMMQQFWSRKSFSAQDGQVTNAYEPQSMLDAYWFTKRNGVDNTTVETLPGGHQLGELSDLDYFLEKLYKTLKVPVSRLNSESSASASSDEITREELRFAKFVMRIQRQVAHGFKQGFEVHLKLKGLWQQYKMLPTDFTLRFTTPTNFQVLKNQQVFSLQSDNFNNLSGNESIANSFAQRHYLEFTDMEIKENREWLRKDAAFRWELAQIESMGPDWEKQQAEALEIEPDFDEGGGSPDGASDFGPGGEDEEEIEPDEATPDEAGAPVFGDEEDEEEL